MTEEAISELFNEPYRPNVSAYEEMDSAPSPTMPAERRSISAADERHPSAISSSPAFRSLAIFSGQDERFAFRRAVSRLHELASPYFWNTARHSPIPKTWRSWETRFTPSNRTFRQRDLISCPSKSTAEDVQRFDLEPEKLKVKFPGGSPGYVHQKKQKAFNQSSSPPRISPVHIWGVLESWGAKAGRWGRGASEYRSKRDRKQR